MNTLTFKVYYQVNNYSTMKAIRKKWILGATLICFLQACNEQADSGIANETKNTVDTLDIGCLGSYELDLNGNGDTINGVYGKDHIKHGRWITYILRSSETGARAESAKTRRTKSEEGFYNKNKRTGLWKFYNEDGSIKDSVEYRDGVPVE